MFVEIVFQSVICLSTKTSFTSFFCPFQFPYETDDVNLSLLKCVPFSLKVTLAFCAPEKIFEP